MRTAQAQAPVVVRDVFCQACSRSFRRLSDKKRHKCVIERQTRSQHVNSMVQPSAHSV